ncbi:MAG: hypothetical protein ACI8RD_013434, partial [Bacillariaceae sp.]
PAKSNLVDNNEPYDAPNINTLYEVVLSPPLPGSLRFCLLIVVDSLLVDIVILEYEA